MCRLCATGLDIIQHRAVSRSMHQRLLRIVEYRDQIQEDFEQMADHLTDFAKCRSMRDYLEHWNLYLHRSYILSELCRPAIGTHHYRKEDKQLGLSLRSLCIESLANTVEAFLGLQNITKFANQSWAAVHRSLSSALLLGILREPVRNERVRSLMSKLATVMSNVTSSLDPSELSAPLARSVTALHKLIPQQSETATGEDHNQTLLSGNIYRFDDQTPSSLSGSTVIGSSPQMGSPTDSNSPYSILNSIFWGPVDSSLS